MKGKGGCWVVLAVLCSLNVALTHEIRSNSFFRQRYFQRHRFGLRWFHHEKLEWQHVDKLLEEASKVKCQRDDEDVCVQGTVEVDPWLVNAFETQYQIAYHAPLHRVPLPSTHNSAISPAYGIGKHEHLLDKFARFFGSRVILANQRFSLTDQMNMGIRQIELDTHWFDGDLRLCHAGGIHLKLVDSFVKHVNQIFHTNITWDTETIGCWSGDIDHKGHVAKSFRSGCEEIMQFLSLPANRRAVIPIYLDDQIDLVEWDKVSYLEEIVQSVFGKLLLTPSMKEDMFPGRWPSPEELVGAGKRVLLASRTPLNSTVVFDAWWSEYHVKDATPFPDCKPHRRSGTDLRRINSASIIYGPLDDDTKKGVVETDRLREYTSCGIPWVSLDQVNPQLLKEEIWSWAEAEPLESGDCAQLGLDGRWHARDCSEQAYFACVKDGPLGSSAPFVSSCAGNWTTPCCPAGTHFGHPIDGYQNAVLHAEANGRKVWVGYARGCMSGDGLSPFRKCGSTGWGAWQLLEQDSSASTNKKSLREEDKVRVAVASRIHN